MKLQNLGRQGFYFFIAGIVAVFLDYSVYSLCLESLGAIFGKLFGFYTGVIVSFVINGHYTFRVKNRNLLSPKCFFRYFLALTVSMVINVTINYLFLSLLEAFFYKMLISFCAATFFSMSFNFIIMKFWVFK